MIAGCLANLVFCPKSKTEEAYQHQGFLKMRLKLALVVLASSALSACVGGLGDDDYAVAGPYGPPGKPTPQVYVPVVASLSDFLAASGTNTVFFDTDKSVLTPQARDVLVRQHAWLVTHREVPIRIEGHADERATSEYNIGLGRRRAESVKSFFVSRGIPASRIQTVTFGEESPVIDKYGDIQVNRRAVTVIDDEDAMHETMTHDGY